jgi:MOSC domain-containing protein YiiM
MRLVSVNVSAGRVVCWRGRRIETGIFKEPVAGRIMIRGFNLDGDRQSDRTVHGGEHKAVYAYSAEHYAWWERELRRPLPFGMFGENLTIESMDEGDVCVGDRFRAGNALLEAVQPRLPCFKLGIRFGDAGMVKRFMESGRFGVYFRVLEEGDVGAGDVVAREWRHPMRFPVSTLVHLLDPAMRGSEMAKRALELEALPPGWVQTLRRGQEG